MHKVYVLGVEICTRTEVWSRYVARAQLQVSVVVHTVVESVRLTTREHHSAEH